MIHQTDSGLPRAIQLYGCNFMCHLYLVRQNWSVQEVINIYQLAVEAGAITANCSVQKPQKLLQLVGSGLRQIGGQELKGKKNHWGVLPPAHLVRFAIAKWSQKNSQHWHFCVVTPEHIELYDPYNPLQASYPLAKSALQSVQYYG
jgi:Protein of unknown function, DUF261